MKNIILLVAFLYAVATFGQHRTEPTQDFTVGGKVKNELRVTISDLKNFKTVAIPDLRITNHKGIEKGTAKDLKGILVKDILAGLEFDVESPKVLSELYLTFIAIDDYRIVYSWNEIFNSTTGDHLFLITAKDGKTLEEMDDRILIATTNDINTGRRYIKNLVRVEVSRVP